MFMFCLDVVGNAEGNAVGMDDGALDADGIRVGLRLGIKDTVGTCVPDGFSVVVGMEEGTREL